MSGNQITSLPLVHQGKVGDVHEIPGTNYLLPFRSNRISGLNVVVKPEMADKGKILNLLTTWWMRGPLRNVVPNHLTGIPLERYLSGKELELARDRAEVVKKLNPLLIEAITRNHLFGTGYQSYLETGEVCGIKLPKGLKEGDRLPEPIFTPSLKSKEDPHITFQEMCNLIGTSLALQIRDVSLKINSIGSDHLRRRGIIVADTKMEYGTDENGILVLMDEVLTPDCSRFWLLDAYEDRGEVVSLDKQRIRDYMQKQSKSGWDKTTPLILPDWLVEEVRGDYWKIYHIITGAA